MKALIGTSLILLALQITGLRSQTADEPAPEPYRLAPGDTVGVIVAGEAELSGSFAINNAGEIAIPLIGSVTIGDMTIADSQEAIKSKLSENILNNPVVFVRVETYRPISVLGEVRNPGVYPYIPGKLAKMVIAQAGGYGQFGFPGGPAELLQATERAVTLGATSDRLRVRQARLMAQLSGATDFTPPKTYYLAPTVAAKLIADERAYIGTQARELAAQIASLEAQRPQLTTEEASIDGQIQTEAHQVALLKTRLAEYEKLEGKGLSRSTDLVQLRLSIAARDGNVWALKAQRSRVALNKMEIGQRIRDLTIQNNARLTGALDDVRRQLLEVEIQLPSARQMVTQRGQAASETATGDSNYTISIVRHRGSKRLEFMATDATLLEPGDLLEVHRLLPLPQPQDTSNLVRNSTAP